MARRGVYGARAVRNVEGTLAAAVLRAVGRSVPPEGRDQACPCDSGRATSRAIARRARRRAAPTSSCARTSRSTSVPEVTRRLVERLYDALNDGGYLLLGHSESLWQMESGFTLVEHDGVFCYRKDARPNAGFCGGSQAKTSPPVPAAATGEKPTGQYERCLEAFRRGEWDQAETRSARADSSEPDVRARRTCCSAAFTRSAAATPRRASRRSGCSA